MTGKVKYKPRCWRDYNKSLIQRGSLCLWVNDDILDDWGAPKETRKGAPRKYLDIAINTI